MTDLKFAETRHKFEHGGAARAPLLICSGLLLLQLLPLLLLLFVLPHHARPPAPCPRPCPPAISASFRCSRSRLPLIIYHHRPRARPVAQVITDILLLTAARLRPGQTVYEWSQTIDEVNIYM